MSPAGSEPVLGHGFLTLDCYVAVLMFANEYASGNRVHVVDILLVQGASLPAALAIPVPVLQLRVSLFSDVTVIG